MSNTNEGHQGSDVLKQKVLVVLAYMLIEGGDLRCR